MFAAMDFLDLDLYGNTTREWGIAAGVFVLVTGALWIVERVFTSRFARLAERSDNDVDDVVLEMLRATRLWFLVFVGVWAATFALILPETVRAWIGTAVALGFIVQFGIWGTRGIRTWVRLYSERKMDSDPAAVTSMKAIGFVSRLILYVLVLLVALDTIGVQVTALLTGLGIGGIAVALAVQNILGDLFASLSIVLDKPFVIGDFVIVGDLMGTIEHIGLKTTRVRSLSGEQLVFSNSDMLNSRIRNFKRMFERRVLFGFGVVYQTPPDKLRAIPPKVQQIIEAQEKTRFDRAHFSKYGASSLDFEVVYYVLAPEYNVYMDIQQAINLAIFEFFEAEGIGFAYPTQTLYVAETAKAESEAEA